MELNKQEYDKYVKKVTPTHPLGFDMLRAFVTGGTICLLGQISMMHNPEGGLLRIGILAVAAAFAVWVVSVVICVKVTAKRDYV